MDKPIGILKVTKEKKMGFTKSGSVKRPYKGRSGGLPGMLRHSRSDILSKTKLSLKTRISIQITCLMEIVAGKEIEAKKGLRASEEGAYNRYILMTPEEREIELGKLNHQFVSLNVATPMVGVGY